jgi:D-sedoheptulose 7-phosphate isomerase
LRQGGKLLLFGNGGSAADAQHIAGELVNKLCGEERMELPALALTTNSSILTSIANDYDYSQIFSVQIRSLGKKGDIALGITTSGNSPNIIEGVKSARKLGLKTIAFLGADGGKVKDLVDHFLLVPHKSTPRVQEVHIIMAHLICQLINDWHKIEAKSKD